MFTQNTQTKPTRCHYTVTTPNCNTGVTTGAIYLKCHRPVITIPQTVQNTRTTTIPFKD